MHRFADHDAAFRHALELGPGARADFLVQLRAGSPELHAAVVELLQLSEDAEGIERTVRRLAGETLRRKLASPDPDGR